jgi:2-phospho-L-lactate guanylyltransferase
MRCWAVVPVKQLSAAKRRLSGVLSLRQRESLVARMFTNVMGVLQQVKDLDGIAIVTPETVIADAGMEMAIPIRDRKPVVWIEDGGAGLNSAIVTAAGRLESMGATAMLTVVADVPFVTAAEINIILTLGRTSSVVIGADRTHRGTNALFLSRPRRFTPEFGEDSLKRHIAAAHRHGVMPLVRRLDGLSFDIDGPSDLEEYESRSTTSRVDYPYMKAERA